MLFHGRLCYMRNAEKILYFFYKNLVLTIPHLFFAFYNGFSGQTMFDDYYISFYNLFFTSWPLLIKATFDQDINYEIEGEAVRPLYPKLYYIGQKSTIFNWSNYLKINGMGLLHALIIFFVPIYVMQEHDQLSPSGANIDIWSVSIISFTSLYTVVTIKIWLWTRFWCWVNFVFYTIFSIFVYIMYIWFSDFWEFS